MTPRQIHESVARWRHRHGYERTHVAAALIDMDGTLYDSMPFHARSWHRLANELGLANNIDEFYEYEGMTGADTLRLLYSRSGNERPDDRTIAELYHRKTVYFSEVADVTAMPGARRLVDTIAAAGITPVLVTGSAQSSLLERLDSDFNGLFARDMRITARDVIHGKPDAEPYLRAMELAKCKPSGCIVIENAPLGVKAGAASGAFTIAVTTGPVPPASMIQAGADILFTSMNELADNIATLLASIDTIDTGSI